MYKTLYFWHPSLPTGVKYCFISMNSPSFHAMYMELAHTMSLRSHCVKCKVGAVITKDTRVVATGYNGPPERTYNCDEQWPEKGCPRSIRGGCLLALHAEQNAILFALKNSIELEGSTLYVTLAPCLPCARLIYSSGITSVFYRDLYAEYKNLPKEEGLEFLEELGVKLVHYKSQHATT